MMVQNDKRAFYAQYAHNTDPSVLDILWHAIETRATRLDLGNCGLTELPDALFEITWLEELILSRYWDEYSFEKKEWEEFKSQNKGKVNQLKSLSLKIEMLRGLKKLIVGNQNELSDLTHLKALTNLQQLYVYRTQVCDLTPLKALTNLCQLVVSNTQVSDLTPLKGLANLQQLVVSYTKVRDLTPLKRLTSLNQIWLSNTQVSDLSPLKNIIEKGVPVKWEKFTVGICVEDTPLSNPPREIVEQGNQAILNYWKQIEEQGGQDDIKEAKLIIVGEGGTGKTTLFEKLKNPRHNPLTTPTPETHGITILEGLELKDGFRANLWDFGGQELQYMTHQFFLTPRALYVLMMDARRESPNLAYWFKIISLLGRDGENDKAQVLLVFNKRQNSTGSPQYDDLLQHYKNDFDYETLTVDFAENDHRWDFLQKTIEERLSRLAISLPKQWTPIREALRVEAQKHAYISTQRFSEICTAHRIPDEADQLVGSKALHKLGQLLHFDEKGLRSHIILSPKWAVNGVYSFLDDASIADNKGRFTEAHFLQILSQKGYSRADADLILQLTTRDHFDICYQSKSGDDYVAAQLLPDNRPPQYKWHPESAKGGALQFRYQYPVMPKGLMSRLIVRLSDHIERIDDAEVVWKKGAILRFEKDGQTCRVKIHEDDAESKTSLKQISIEVLGEPSYRKFALQKVRDEVEELHKKWFRNIQVDEIIPCCCTKCRITETPKSYLLGDLLELWQNKKIKQCNTGEEVEIYHLLEGIYDKKQVENLFYDGKEGRQYVGKRQNVFDDERILPNIHLHIENKPQFTNIQQTQGLNEQDTALLKQLLAQLTSDRQAQLKTFVETLPEAEDEDDKKTYGKQILKWLNKNAEGIVGNVAASVYYDGLKQLFGIG